MQIANNRRRILPRDVFWILMLAMCRLYLPAELSAQPGRYTRKSVAYVDALLVSDENIQVPQVYERLLLDAFHEQLRLSRFDYNQLPEAVQANFKDRLRGRGLLGESELENLIAQSIVPEIMKVLDLEKELRAQQLVSETQRQSFIVQKAKDLGITAEQIEQILKSAFLYIPFLDKYQIKQEKDKKDISVNLQGGVIWYKVIVGDEPRVEKILRITTEGTAATEKDKMYSLDRGNMAGEEAAICLAAQTMAMNLQVRTREINLFKLRTPLADVERRTVRFPLGKAEGIKLDEPFYVGEYLQTNSGKIRFNRSGFVRVSTVADNSQNSRQLSSAYAIKKGDWVKGMTMIEHPRLGVDVALKPRWYNLRVKEGLVLTDDFLVYFNDYEGVAVGTDLDLQWNIAQLTRKRQSFLVVGATGALAPVKSKVYDSAFEVFFDMPTENWVAGVLNGYAGYLRRFYLGPLALHGEALLGVQRLVVSDSWDHESVSIANTSFGARINAGLEYAVNIDVNIGIFAGVNLFPPLDLWTVKYKDKEIDVDNLAGWAAPRISSISPTFGLYLHYSPPKLNFNPAGMIQGSVRDQLFKIK